MAQNGSKMEVAMVEMAAEVMVVLMALKQIAKVVILSFFRRKQELNFKDFFFK